jgi:ribosome-binding factor A
MSTIRQQKVESLLKKELAVIFQKESRNLFGGAFITVTTVRITPDLGYAKVYLSFFGTKDKEALFDKVKAKTSTIRWMLGKEVGKQLRIVPELRFYADDSLDYAQKIDDLLKD